VGEIVWLKDENLLDIVTAVSGSGPAYVFWLIEQLAPLPSRREFRRPTRCGLRSNACSLGQARGGERRGAGQLRKNVTSKGGTTEAALDVYRTGKARAALP